MLVVLSENSVKSENVLDEIAFALKERKEVIPILYRDCVIPYRLGRLQYIDFRSDYCQGMNELERHLTANEPSPASTILLSINTLTSKGVLMLGRFTAERKVVLDAIHNELVKRGYLPIVFDFERSTGKSLTGTMTALANMVRFIIVDLIDPYSVPFELASLVGSTVVPIQPIIFGSHREYPLLAALERSYHWVLKPYEYSSQQVLLEHLDNVIGPPEAKAMELLLK